MSERTRLMVEMHLVSDPGPRARLAAALEPLGREGSVFGADRLLDALHREIALASAFVEQLPG